jgi:hypothetical protein
MGAAWHGQCFDVIGMQKNIMFFEKSSYTLGHCHPSGASRELQMRAHPIGQQQGFPALAPNAYDGYATFEVKF